jgi:hypothetical protein
LILQHLFGYKADVDKFSDVRITEYDKIYFYDDNRKSIESIKMINDYLSKFLIKTDSVIKSEIEKKYKIIIIKESTNNKVNPFIETEVLVGKKIIKTFESFSKNIYSKYEME